MKLLFIGGPKDGEWLEIYENKNLEVRSVNPIRATFMDSEKPTSIEITIYKEEEIAWTDEEGNTKTYFVMIPADNNKNEVLEKLLQGYRKPIDRRITWAKPMRPA